MKCAVCDEKLCEQTGKDCTGGLKREIKINITEEMRTLEVSAGVEADFYMDKSRVEEVQIFSERMGFRKIGIAFCVGLSEEAKNIHKIFSSKFEVYSVCCKVCGIEKQKYSFDVLDVAGEPDIMCNPIGQAEILNKKETDLNIIVGLCIGHDLLFNKYSDGYVTTLAVKDRKLAHNPLGFIYSGYYS